MNNEYHRDIVELLIKGGVQGVRLRRIAQCVYNRHCGLFATEVVYAKIYSQVRFYLCRQVSGGRSPFLRTSRGRYSIKPDFAVQLDFLPKLALPELDQRPSRTASAPKAVQLQLFPESVAS